MHCLLASLHPMCMQEHSFGSMAPLATGDNMNETSLQACPLTCCVSPKVGVIYQELVLSWIHAD